MKILIITPINPILAGSVYTTILDSFKEESVTKNTICFPFFAQVRAEMNNQAFIPTFFAMLKTSKEKGTYEKIYDAKNLIVIGTDYKTEKYDIVVAYDESDEDEPFDSYLKEIKENEELQEFAKKVEVEKLYGVEDATISLPTKKHLRLFLEGVLNDEPITKSK